MRRLLCLIVLVAGCKIHTIIVPPGEPVQLAEDTPAVVYVTDKDRKQFKTKTVLKAGWWVLPDPAR